MTEFSFSDKDLQLAASKVRTALLESLPPPSDCAHEFSDSFLGKMNRLLQQDKHKQTRKKAFQRIAAVFLALLIGAGALFAFNSDVRAAVIQWVREVYENSILYRFSGEKVDAVLPDCEIDWLPDGYMETDVYQDGDLFSALYENKSGKSIVINYYYMQDGTFHDVVFEDEAKYSHKVVSINENPADYYEVTDGYDSNDLIWIDEESKIAFHISSYLNDEVMIRIVENIRLKDY